MVYELTFNEGFPPICLSGVLLIVAAFVLGYEMRE
jgi:hypothetical protein